jgi:hypothetical protein
MAEFTLPLTAEGSVTAPTGTFAFIEPSAESQTFLDVGPAHVLELPEFGWAVADGVNPLRLVTKGGVYDAGGIAPNVALTALAGTRATATLITGNGATTDMANGDVFGLAHSPIGAGTIVGRTTLSSIGSGASWEFKRGVSLADTLSNITKMINGTGTNGVEYLVGENGPDAAGNPYVNGYFYNVGNWEITGTTGTTTKTTTFRKRSGGAYGNNGLLSEVLDGGATWSVVTFSATGTGANGSGTEPQAGTYRYFYAWYRAADGAETGRSPITSITKTTNDNVSISDLTASADTTFDFIRIYRTTNLGVEFYLVGTVARATTTFTDDVSDTTLALGIPWNELLHRAYAEGSVPRARALALWKGSVYSIGAHLAADYVRGTVAVTEGSAAITFSVKGVTALMRNRTLVVAATSEEYTLISVDEAGPTAVLDRAYEGTTNGTASFTIKDDYDACAIRRCVPFLYNQWPVDESPGRVDTDDSEGGTALLATHSRLFAFSRTSIAALTGEGPESWEISKVGQGIGCVAPRLVVGIDAGDGVVTGGMFLAPSGFYALSASGSLLCVSSPKASKKALATGIDGTVARINWATVDQGYSYFDNAERVVVFGLPLDGAVVPNYEIVFDLQNGTWTTFKRAEFTDACNATLPGGGQFILTGDRDGNLWHVDIGESDGFYGVEAVQTLTGAQTVRALTASGTPYTTSGDALKGMPFVVLYANGTTVAYGKVASNTNAVITPAEDLDTAPAASDQIIVGAIAAQAQSGFTTAGEEFRQKGLRSVTLRHAPISRGTYFFSFAVNGGLFALPPVGTGIGSLSDTTGKVRHFTQWPGDTHAINVRRFQPGGRMILRGGVFEFTLREMPSR